jgi:hypothetical protein
MSWSKRGWKERGPHLLFHPLWQLLKCEEKLYENWPIDVSDIHTFFSFQVGTGVVVGKTILLGLAGNCKFSHFSSDTRMPQFASLQLQ